MAAASVTTTLNGDVRHYETQTSRNGCVTITVRRYNLHIVGFSRIRLHMLKKLHDQGLPLFTDAKCALHAVPSTCAHCQRSLTLTPAVSCLPCGHSCLCADCDDLFSDKCFECKRFVKCKLKFKK
ncbi:hypothetical protein QKQ66_gp112 [Dione juno nucleopolyhedrovirus]|uniref:RING-type domain-containing protein n=1 Tax=Dione juno nucleopolyhedrovirus TaxID=2594175 RepID=A0AAE6LC89_9ABAC|nr:hypothetical protein QKQ66_gp112 [Dione juno nucleopolyhedrovirus]QDL57055.1 hypothetical protein DijuNPV-ORF-112 [Dione juno nucleopolyhedrovirus]